VVPRAGVDDRVRGAVAGTNPIVEFRVRGRTQPGGGSAVLTTRAGMVGDRCPIPAPPPGAAPLRPPRDRALTWCAIVLPRPWAARRRARPSAACFGRFQATLCGSVVEPGHAASGGAARRRGVASGPADGGPAARRHGAAPGRRYARPCAVCKRKAAAADGAGAAPPPRAKIRHQQAPGDLQNECRTCRTMSEFRVAGPRGNTI
jgi:hypothetical protein